jgi:hypothetical protein
MKEWIIVIGIEKFYLTDKEKNYYLSALNTGVKFVDMGDKILGANFQYMAKTSVFEETKMLDEGKWRCEFGKWHTKGWACSCEAIGKIKSIEGIGEIIEKA